MSERVELSTGGWVGVEHLGRAHGGAAVLLLRPLAGSMALWGEFAQVLAERMRVIAFDPRGVGDSSDAPVDVTTRAMAADAVALLDALGEPTAHVFGISLGAMVATWMAVDAPERVTRLCLASAGAVGFALTLGGAVRGVEMAASVLAPESEVVAKLAGAVLSEDVRAKDPARVAEVEESASHDPARRGELLKHAIAAARHDAREVVGRIVAPTLVLGGDHDELIGEEPPRALAEAIGGARYERIAEAGHDLTLEQPRATALAVAAFLLA